MVDEVYADEESTFEGAYKFADNLAKNSPSNPQVMHMIKEDMFANTVAALAESKISDATV